MTSDVDKLKLWEAQLVLRLHDVGIPERMMSMFLTDRRRVEFLAGHALIVVRKCCPKGHIVKMNMVDMDGDEVVP